MLHHLKKSGTLIVFVAFPMLFSACATRTTVTTEAQGLPRSDVSVLRIAKVAGNKACCFYQILDENGNVVRQQAFSESLTEVTVKPGLIEVVLRVHGGYRQLSSSPSVVARVEAGKVYDFASSEILNGIAVNAEYAEARVEAVAK